MQVTVQLQEDDALEGLSESGHRVLMDRSCLLYTSDAADD